MNRIGKRVFENQNGDILINEIGKETFTEVYTEKDILILRKVFH